jgi:hypothetical protein
MACGPETDDRRDEKQHGNGRQRLTDGGGVGDQRQQGFASGTRASIASGTPSTTTKAMAVSTISTWLCGIE